MPSGNNVIPEPSGPDHAGPAEAPRWVLVVGAAFALLTLLFLMVLVVLGVMGKSVPCDSRFLVNAVFSLGVGLSTSFLGGYVATKGEFGQKLQGRGTLGVSAGGGVAIVAALIAVGHFTFLQDPACNRNAEQVSDVNQTVLELAKDVDVLSSTYERLDEKGSHIAKLRDQVLTRAPQLGKQLLNISDQPALTDAHAVTKYIYAGKAFVMASSIATQKSANSPEGLDYAVRASAALDASATLVERIQTAQAAGDGRAKAEYEWALRAAAPGRIHFLRAVAATILYRASPTADRRMTIVSDLKKIGTAFLETNPLYANPELCFFLTQDNNDTIPGLKEAAGKCRSAKGA